MRKRFYKHINKIIGTSMIAVVLSTNIFCSTGFAITGEVTESVTQSSAIPASYSSVEKGYITSVKNQNPYGTCWAHAAIATIEAYILKMGYETKTTENPDGINLSEYALIYSINNDDMYYDKTGDKTYNEDLEYAFTCGGNDYNVYKALSKWTGLVKEDVQKPVEDYGDEITITENDVAYILSNQQFLDMTDMEGVKSKIMSNGAVTSSYYSDDRFAVDTKDYVHYYLYNYCYEYTNHAITIVGWDDNMPKENFAITEGGVTYMPSRDGAWYVKNSWGTYFGDDGYMWISYDDISLQQSMATAYEVVPRSKYDKNYQHDGATVFGRFSIGGNNFANVYTVDGDKNELIETVAFALLSENAEYSIQIYINPEEDNPTSGTAALDTPITGKTAYNGYYTVELDEPVEVKPGDTFAVTIEFEENVYMLMSEKEKTVNISSFVVETITEQNESYLSQGYGWLDVADEYWYGIYEAGYGAFSIKAFTNIVEDNNLEEDEEDDDDIIIPSFIYGDVNGDGEVKSNDVILLKRFIAGYEGLNVNESAMDVNLDGQIKVNDAILIMRYIAGYDVVLGQ